MHAESLHLREIIVFLAAAALVVPMMQRLRVNPVLGFLVIGVVIGPFGLGRLAETWTWLGWIVIDDLEQVRHLAEFGVIFLLFMIGLDLSFARLWQMRRLVFGLGGSQVIFSGIIIGAIAYGFGNSPAASIVLGACLALSSTAIVMELLVKSRRLGTRTGRTCFGILLFQDLAVVPILFLVGILGQDMQGQTGPALAIALGKASLAIISILLLGRMVVRPVFAFVGSTGSRELFMAAVLLVIIATATVTAQAGLSAALGAFMAGMLLSESEYRHQIEVDVEPFKGLLLGLFFVSVGMAINVQEILREPLWIPLSVAGLIIIKTAITFVLALAFKQPRSVALESALLLSQGGEFAFVVIALAVSLALLPADVAQFMLIIASMTMLMTPLIEQSARRLGALLDERDIAQGPLSVPDMVDAPRDVVIIAGYGRVGQFLGSLLGENRICHVGLDIDTELVTRFRKGGAGVYFGDASNPDILKKIGIENAMALAVTMDSPHATERVIKAVRKACPNLPILARARDMEHANALRTAGANDVVSETLEASLELAESVFRATGFSDDAAHQVIADRRNAEKQTQPSPSA